jgi:hypothetical protein
MNDLALPTTFILPAIDGEAEHVFAVHPRMWPGEPIQYGVRLWRVARTTLEADETGTRQTVYLGPVSKDTQENGRQP